jgi:hypothetical protein
MVPYACQLEGSTGPYDPGTFRICLPELTCNCPRPWPGYRALRHYLDKAHITVAVTKMVTGGRNSPILHGLDGVLQKGKLLLAFGHPGSHGTTFLKTIIAQTRILELDSQSLVECRGTTKARILEGGG